MNAIELIKNRWAMSLVACIYAAVLWGGFQWIYRHEIELQRLAQAETPNLLRTMRMYRALSSAPVQRTNLDTFVTLGDLLERVKRWDEAAVAWHRILDVIPEQRWPRQRLALALHNGRRYAEAEPYFTQLLYEHPLSYVARLSAKDVR